MQFCVFQIYLYQWIILNEILAIVGGRQIVEFALWQLGKGSQTATKIDSKILSNLFEPAILN